jgi:hypothetical protein
MRTLQLNLCATAVHIGKQGRAIRPAATSSLFFNTKILSRFSRFLRLKIKIHTDAAKAFNMFIGNFPL